MFKPKEKDIERQICDWLAAKGYFFWKQANSGYFDGRTKRFRRHTSPYCIRGVSDIIIIDKGQFIGVEVKSESGRLSDHQKAFRDSVINAGGKYILCRSLDDLAIGLMS